jgi:2-polyprenyl-3-methyl-5-hydroxy-6-metoxy-1,4-benzoquinol methylase
MEKYIKQKAINRSPLHILEAGCGQYWPLDLKDIQFTLTGVDIDEDALQLRRSRYNDLSKIIVGDLRSVDLQKNRYDVIYNSYVLEHIDGAEGVLDKFSNWLKPGGILILRIPDRNSVRGFFTRVTPFWFHVFYNKYIVRFRDAGKSGFGPYPTFYNPVVSRAGIREYCRNNHFIIKEEYGQGSDFGEGITGFLIYLIARTVSLLSLGKTCMGVQRLNLRPRERVGVCWHNGNIVIPLLAKKSYKNPRDGISGLHESEVYARDKSRS